MCVTENLKYDVFLIFSWVCCGKGINEEKHSCIQRQEKKSGMRESIKKAF